MVRRKQERNNPLELRLLKIRGQRQHAVVERAATSDMSHPSPPPPHLVISPLHSSGYITFVGPRRTRTRMQHNCTCNGQHVCTPVTGSTHGSPLQELSVRIWSGKWRTTQWAHG